MARAIRNYDRAAAPFQLEPRGVGGDRYERGEAGLLTDVEGGFVDVGALSCVLQDTVGRCDGGRWVPTVAVPTCCP